MNILKTTALSTLTLLALTGTAQAETTVGRWCDQMLPGNADYNGIKTIVQKDNGEYELRSRYADGSSKTEKLTKQGGVYHTFNNHGEKYRILGNGNLELADAEGPFREASRLGNTPKPGDCGIK